jgi:hypothetical protein
MKKRVRVEDVEALLREIARYRAELEATRKRNRPPKRRGGGRSER